MAGNSGKLYVGQQVASTAAAWQAGHTYALGAVVKVNGGVYVCTTAGDSAGSGGPTGTGAGIVDNTAKWDYQSTYQISALNAFELNASESHFFRVSDASTLFVLGSAANQVVAFEGS